MTQEESIEELQDNLKDTKTSIRNSPAEQFLTFVRLQNSRFLEKVRPNKRD